MTQLIGEICSRHELILGVIMSELHGSEEKFIRVKQDVGGLQRTIMEQASKIEQLESKLEKAETELECEKKDLTLTRECLAGVSSQTCSVCDVLTRVLGSGSHGLHKASFSSRSHEAGPL